MAKRIMGCDLECDLECTLESGLCLKHSTTKPRVRIRLQLIYNRMKPLFIHTERERLYRPFEQDQLLT
ncbi:hypothetical protein BDF14DRAFT_1867439 [Spinellus fusiger]|nr:hypothetical protein BDF14DRAFT_1867439 [Spinellus fusiger]